MPARTGKWYADARYSTLTAYYSHIIVSQRHCLPIRKSNSPFGRHRENTPPTKRTSRDAAPTATQCTRLICCKISWILLLCMVSSALQSLETPSGLTCVYLLFIAPSKGLNNRNCATKWLMAHRGSPVDSVSSGCSHIPSGIGYHYSVYIFLVSP